MKKIVAFTAICVSFTFNIPAQENVLLRQLLDLPAPPPSSRKITNIEIVAESVRKEDFYKKENVPPDDAPIEDLIDFWKRQNYYESPHPDKIKPSEKTLRRLLESLEDQPENLSDFLKLLPETEEVATKVKDIFDTNNKVFDEISRKTIEKWLKYNSKYFSDELFAEAQKARDHKTYKNVINEQELRALAKVDWERAESLLQRLENDTNNPRTAFAVKRLFYERAIETNDSATADRYRDEFKKLVENKNASGTERDDALDALRLNKDWAGQDDWYISLFQDQTLLELSVGDSTFSRPLDNLVEQNPDKWIPIVSRLINNKNRTIHNSAVQALAQFYNQDARRDALEPLVPWIANPDWAKVESDGRFRLIQSLNSIDIPESVPGLLWVVENDEESYTRSYAASSLVSYKDPRIAQALKNALQREPQETHRNRIIQALFSSDSLTDDEQIVCLESYVNAISTPEGHKKVEDRSEYEEENPLPVSVSIGKYISKLNEPGEGLIVRASERYKVLEREKPQIAKILAGIMAKWKGRLFDLEMTRRISNNEADPDTIIRALARRKELKESVPNDLYSMRGKIGLPSAIAACILEDENDILSAFGSQNTEMKIGMLACARLLRKPLPVNEVGLLINSNNSLLALAAERYLESEDSPEARRLVLLKHPNEALILGARDSFNPTKQKISDNVSLNELFSTVSGYLSGSNYADIEKFETKLRKELLENPDLTEIYARLPNQESYQKIVRVYKDKVVFTSYDDAARYRERVLSKKEIDFLQNTIKQSPIENSPPIYSYCHYRCGSSEYVRLNRNGGRRVYSVTSPTLPEPLKTIADMFDEFDKGEFKTHYNLSNKIKGLELIFADEKLQPKAIWKNGDDFRVLIVDEARKERISEEIDGQNKIDDLDEDLDYDIRGKNSRQRQIDREFEPYEWREFKAGKLAEKVEEPMEIPFLRDNLTFPAVQKLQSNTSIRQSKSGYFEIRAEIDNEGSLWKTNRSQQIEFKQGNYSRPYVIGNYVVAAKTDDDWSVPNYIVRIDLQTGKETKINLPPAEDFYPVAVVPVHNKILLYRDAEPKLKKPAEYYLLDAATGKTEPVKGEFRPLIQQTFRSLQPTENPNEFWAAIYDREKNQTVIGRYDAKNFAIKIVLTVPEISLNSMHIWVDEKDGKVYFIYQPDEYKESHLLSLPLDAEKQ